MERHLPAIYELATRAAIAGLPSLVNELHTLARAIRNRKSTAPAMARLSAMVGKA